MQASWTNPGQRLNLQHKICQVTKSALVVHRSNIYCTMIRGFDQAGERLMDMDIEMSLAGCRLCETGPTVCR